MKQIITARRLAMISAGAAIAMIASCGSGETVDLTNFDNEKGLEYFTTSSEWDNKNLDPVVLEGWIAECTASGTCGSTVTPSSSAVAVDPSSSSVDPSSSGGVITPSSSGGVITPSSSGGVITPSSSSKPSSSSAPPSSSSSKPASSSSSAPPVSSSSSQGSGTGTTVTPENNSNNTILANSTVTYIITKGCAFTIQVGGLSSATDVSVSWDGGVTWNTPGNAWGGPFSVPSGTVNFMVRNNLSSSKTIQISFWGSC